VQQLNSEEKKLRFLTGSETDITTPVTSSNIAIRSISAADTSILKQHPFAEAYSAQGTILEKEKEVVIARALPDISFGYVNQTLVGVHSISGESMPFGPSHRFSAGQMSLEIPVFYGSTRKRSDALNIQMEQNRMNGLYALNDLSTAYDQELSTYKSLIDSKQLYDLQLIPQNQVMLEQAQQLLATGEVSMIEFLQTRQMITETELNYIELQNSINQSIHRLNWYVENEKK
jgi:cobalt-zinc-cadmium resistance protein CzcA